jgi:ABC-2 type transport system ATP-binding protein
MEQILARESPHRLVIVRAAEGTDALQRELLQSPGVGEVRVAGEEVEFRLDGGDDVQSSILAHLVGKGFRVIEYRQRQIDLEDVFMNVTKGDVT